MCEGSWSELPEQHNSGAPFQWRLHPAQPVRPDSAAVKLGPEACRGWRGDPKSHRTPQFRLDLVPHPNSPRSLISVPLGGLLCRYGLAPGISVILRNSREPPGSGKEAGESPKSILPLVTQLHILFTLQRGVRVSSSTKGTINAKAIAYLGISSQSSPV